MVAKQPVSDQIIQLRNNYVLELRERTNEKIVVEDCPCWEVKTWTPSPGTRATT